MRFLARLGALAGTVFAVSVCGEGKFGQTTGPTADTTPPKVVVNLPGGRADTLVEIADSLKFSVTVTDERIDSVFISVNGLAGFTWAQAIDTALSSGPGTFNLSVKLELPAASAGQHVLIEAWAYDHNLNRGSDSITVRVNDTQAPVTTIISPTASLLIGSGDTIKVLARAQDPSGIAVLGARIFLRDTVLQSVQPIAWDDTTYTPPLLGARQDSFKVVVPATLKPGNYLLQVYSQDGSSNSWKGASTPDLTVAVRDIRPPAGSFLNPPQDSQLVAGDTLTLRFRATDNAGVVSVTFRGYSQRGNAVLGEDTTVLRYDAKTANLPLQPADTTLIRKLAPVLSDSTPEAIFIEARVTDVGGNVAVVTQRVQTVAGPSVRVTTPVSGARVPVGVPLSIGISGYHPDSVKVLGYVSTGVAPARDSVVLLSPLATSRTSLLSLAIPTTAQLGADTITPFVISRLGERISGARVVVALTDTVKPTVTILQPNVVDVPTAMGDSVLVQVRVQDNRGVSRLVLSGASKRGSPTYGTDTTVTRYVTKTVSLTPSPDTTIYRYLFPVPKDSTSEIVYIVVTAQDSSGNASADTATVRIVGGPKLTMLRPTTGALTSPGRSMIVQIFADGQRGVRLVGWRATGVYTAKDSVFYAPVNGRMQDTLTFTDTLTVPTATPLGTFTISPFAVDSVGDVSGAVAGVTVTVQSGAADVTPPTVSFALGSRIEATDSIVVNARDAGGLRRVGWKATLQGTTTQVGADSVTFTATPLYADVSVTSALNLLNTMRFPAQVVVQAFAQDSTGNRATSVAETLTVVAGRTFSLPAGTAIGDAIYNAHRRELYLSNTALDRIEVFSVASNRFVASIPVGSRPMGLALWPKDTLGNNADTLIVANSGGTNLSLVDLVGRREYRRYRLPNYVVQKIKTAKDGQTGLLRITVTDYDFSDRPQYVASVCRAVGLNPCGDVLALYSTTPTPGQTGFPSQGYLAWENLTHAALDSVKSHFFYEHATANITLATDTLQIIAIRDSVLGATAVDTLVGGGAGVIVAFDEIPFQDSTFVRSSGNYLRSLVGEGGGVALARALSFDPRAGTRTILGDATGCLLLGLACYQVHDDGISGSVFVRDFIANRASTVSAIAINQSGNTMVVRADSIYVFDRTLRLTGIVAAGGGAAGMDFHPNNRFDAAVRGTGGLGGTGSPNDRLLFAARPDSSIDVFDSYFYGEVTDTTTLGSPIPVPIRNALIGPVRVASDTIAVGNVQTLLFGLTTRGLVSVRLPGVTNSLFPVTAMPTVRHEPLIEVRALKPGSPPPE